MNICVFDTETTSLDKPFCYNVGYVIYDTENQKIITKHDFVIEQIWHNLPLFSTAYYAEKRQNYVSAMRGKTAFLAKWGAVTTTMRNEFKRFNVEHAFAYNSDFDERVFDFNCDWFKTINPFETVPVSDIRGHAISYLVDNNYFAFCENHKLFTESGNYSTTAEALYRFISQNADFVEAHTALNDSEIELQILLASIEAGAILEHDYSIPRSIKREVQRHLTIFYNKSPVFEIDYNSIRQNREKTEIFLK